MNAYALPGLTTTPESLTIIAANVCEIPVEMLYVKTQKRNIAECRGLAFFLIRNILKSSLLNIGVPFHTDHSTVSYWVKKTTDTAQVDKCFRERFIKACQKSGIRNEQINDWLR